MSLCPPTYDREAYISWHETNIPEDSPLEEKLSAYLDGLRESAKKPLKTLGDLLTQIAARTEPEAKIQSKNLLTGDYVVPSGQLRGVKGSEPYDNLFKSQSSIIEKLWRKNKKRSSEFVRLSNLGTELADLARTSVVSPTLVHARMFVERLACWRDLLGEGDAKKYFAEVKAVTVDPEAKADAGYFAYHCNVHIADLTIEVQVYSSLASAWRHISHKLYEKARIGEAEGMDPGSPSARLVSLGHLLHLAECELERLVDDQAA